MATARYVPHKCPACQAQLNPDARGRCRTCGADLVGKPAQAVFRADDAIATLQGRYDALAAEWREWASGESAIAAATGYGPPLLPEKPNSEQVDGMKRLDALRKSCGLPEVELDAEKMVVLGQVVAGVRLEELRVGMRMELVVDTLFQDATKEHVVWKWKPTGH